MSATVEAGAGSALASLEQGRPKQEPRVMLWRTQVQAQPIRCQQFQKWAQRAQARLLTACSPVDRAPGQGA